MKRFSPAGSASPVKNDLAACSGLGTLLWVGDRRSRLFADAYDFCDATVSQIAYRSDLPAALARPATDVSAVIWCRENDSAVGRDEYRGLLSGHPKCDRAMLLGPLCAGQRPHPSALHGVPTCYWNEWEPFLPKLLTRCGFIEPVIRRPNSVIVVANSFSNASALLTLAECSRTSATWCRPQELKRVRQAGQVWWDDSATPGGRCWHSRIASCGHPDAKHVWIVSHLTPSQKRDAMLGGISLVLTKPGDYLPLIQMTRPTAIVSSREAA